MAPPSPPPYHTDRPPPSYWQPTPNSNNPTLIDPQRRRDVHYQHAGPVGHPRVLFLVSIVRPWAIVVPFVTVVMDVWWFASGRLCGGIDDLGSECYWILWLSFPIAIASIAWNLSALVSNRRMNSYRHGIPMTIQLFGQSLIASGSAVCLGLLSWHYAEYWIYMRHLEGAMIALVAMITVANWLMVVFVAYDWNLDRRNRQDHELDTIR